MLCSQVIHFALYPLIIQLNCLIKVARLLACKWLIGLVILRFINAICTYIVTGSHGIVFTLCVNPLFVPYPSVQV